MAPTSRADDGPGHDDDGWVRVVGDGVEVVVPEPQRLQLLDALADRALRFPEDVMVQVQEPTGPRDLPDGELRWLLDDAARACRDALEEPGAALADEEAAELAQAAAVLATIWSIALQAADQAPAPTDVAWVGALGRLAADCEDMFTTRIRRQAGGTYSLRWGVVDRRVVRRTLEALRAMVDGDDPAITRLFPTAYGSDEERNAGWDVLVRGELIERRQASMDIAESLLGRRTCDDEELAALMRCCNDARLVLGTRLDVGEDGTPAEGGPEQLADEFAYERLGHLVAQAVEALEGDL